MGINNGSRVASAKPKVGGGFYWAPLNTVLPTDATTALAAAYVAMGPISSQGFRPARTTNTELEREWDGSPLAELLTEEDRSGEVDILGVFDPDPLKVIYGADNVTVVAATSTTGTKLSIVDRGGKPLRGVAVFETIHEGAKSRRIYPIASPVITNERAFISGGLRGYTLRIQALKDSSGAFSYEYSELDDKTA